MKVRVTILLVCLLAAALSMACSRSNNLLLGRVEATVGGHTVAVTDCYRMSVPQPRKLESVDGKPGYRFTPCKDADVVISGEELTVNGKSYRPLKQGDAVTVDHGKVLINDREASLTATPASI